MFSYLTSKFESRVYHRSSVYL